ncbi:MAG: GTPase HflX, partial [Alphaproteobacteria bacterium]
SDLPTPLIAAFRATLEEVREADLILHVRDGAHPETQAQRDDVLAVLATLGVEPGGEGPPVLEVVNKIDRMSEETRAAWRAKASRSDDMVAISALTGEGMDALLERIDAHLFARARVLNVTLAASEGAALAWLYRHGKVLARHSNDQGVVLKVRLDDQALARWRQQHPS